MKKIRLIIDILMVTAMPLLMAYSLIGENIHEVIGVCLFAAFITHHIINRKWWAGLFKGRYNPVRMMNTAVDLLLAVYMILQPVCGILMSKHVLSEVTIEGASSTLRTLHMTVAYWGFMLVSFHLGLHIRAVSASFKKHMGKGAKAAFTVIFLLISAYGIYAFIKRGIGDYLMMKMMFAFFDFGEARARFILDYASIMVLVANIGYYLQSVLLNKHKKDEED